MKIPKKNDKKETIDSGKKMIPNIPLAQKPIAPMVKKIGDKTPSPNTNLKYKLYLL